RQGAMAVRGSLQQGVVDASLGAVDGILRNPYLLGNLVGGREANPVNALYTRPQYDDQQRLLEFARPDNIILTNLVSGEPVLERMMLSDRANSSNRCWSSY